MCVCEVFGHGVFVLVHQEGSPPRIGKVVLTVRHLLVGVGLFGLPRLFALGQESGNQAEMADYQGSSLLSYRHLKG